MNLGEPARKAIKGNSSIIIWMPASSPRENLADFAKRDDKWLLR